MQRGVPRFFAMVVSIAAAVPASFAAGGDADGAWVVGIAAFDTAGLPLADRLAGDLMVRDLARAVEAVDSRLLDADERAAYERHLKAAAVATAAADHEAARAARDALLFKGAAAWKYREEKAKADEAVTQAREKFDEVVAAAVEAAATMPVSVAREKDELVFTSAPAAGLERVFCFDRGCDALLTGAVRPYYGRSLVTVRLYSPYLDRALYADRTIFSVEERDRALGELRGRLTAAISGLAPASIAVRTDPEDADVYLGGLLVGKGAVGPLELVPGAVSVGAAAAGREPFAEKVEIGSGEEVSLTITLPAIPSATFGVDAYGLDPAGADPAGAAEAEGTPAKDAPIRLSVGGLYRADAPASLTLDRGKSAYLTADSGAAFAAAVIRPDQSSAYVLPLTPKPPKDARPVEDARGAFYAAFGRFSVCLPLAFLATGLGTSYENAAIVYDSATLEGRSDQARIASTTLWTITGIFAVEAVFRFVRYVSAAADRAVDRY